MIHKTTRAAVAKDWMVVICLSLTLAGLLIYNRHLSGSLHKNAVIVPGNVTEAFVLPKRGRLAYYHFLIKGQGYSCAHFLPAFKNVNERQVLVGHYFPVVADSSDYTNNKMLFDSAGFAEYGLPYPDSLRWLKKYLK